MSDPRPRPRAFRLDDTEVVMEPRVGPIPTLAREIALDEDEREIEIAQQKGMLARWRPSLGALFWSGLGGLVSLGLGLWFTELVESLFARAQALGWIGAAFGALALIALIAIGAREAAAILRQSRIARLHADLARAQAGDDGDAARMLIARLITLYERRPETAAGRAEVAEAAHAIIDGRDL